MRLIERIGRRPLVVALAGPNGAGKSTFYEAHMEDCGLLFVNADVLSASLRIDAYAAAALADRFRHDLIAQKESFIFETVFSDPVGEKLEFLKAAKESGYAVVLIFIGVASPKISDTRVAARAAGGGHDVPLQKLMERFPRTMENLKRALTELPDVLVYDHSDLQRGYRLVAAVEDGDAIALYKPTPAWLKRLLPKR